MDCKKAQSLVTLYIGKKLDDKETEEFLNHIDHCKECHEELEIYFTVHFALQKLDEDKDVSYNIQKMLKDDEEARRRKIRRRKVLRYSCWGTLLLAELILVLVLFTQSRLMLEENGRIQTETQTEIQTETQTETQMETQTEQIQE
jgi:predicted anti-sigma-YlaC factor YlaD